MARVTLAQSAQTDLLEAWLFIAEDNQQAAAERAKARQIEAEIEPLAA